LAVSCRSRTSHPTCSGPRLPAAARSALYEPAENIEKGVGSENLPGAHTFGGLQVEATGKDRQPGPQPLFLHRAQLMTPADRRAQRLMTVLAASCRSEEQEPIVKPGDDLLDRHGAQPYGC
jgi:hypothetical protein